MNEPVITWIRLFDGRLWHAQESPDTTWCGKPLVALPASRQPERIDGAPPAYGWVCDRCVRALHELAAVAAAVWRGDPRRRAGDQIQAELEPPPEGPTGTAPELEVPYEDLEGGPSDGQGR